MTSARAKLSKTRILSMQLENGNHLLSYSNSVLNLSDGTNSMILPIPGELKQEWFYDTTDYNKFLIDIETQAGERTHSMTLSRSTKSLEIFNLGMYKIVLTQDIRKALESGECDDLVIMGGFIDFMENHYNGFSFVICIFDGNKEMDAQPIMFEYKPVNYDIIYFPTMDTHDGSTPNLKARVEMDHTLITEDRYLLPDILNNVSFSQKVPKILEDRSYVAYKYEDFCDNGDMFLNTVDLKKTPLKQDIKRQICFPGGMAEHQEQMEKTGYKENYEKTKSDKLREAGWKKYGDNSDKWFYSGGVVDTKTAYQTLENKMGLAFVPVGALIILPQDFIPFSKWLKKLSPVEKCSVHTSMGSGIRELSIGELFEKWLRKNKKSNEKD